MRKFGWLLVCAAIIGWLVLRLAKLEQSQPLTDSVTSDQMREEFQRFREEIDSRISQLEALADSA